MCFDFLSDVSAEITFPKANNPIFIFIPSRIAEPVFPVFFNLSEPARSTK